MNLARTLFDSSRRFPDRPAIFVGGTHVATYAAWAAETSARAALLRSLGCVTGDRVALCLTNRPDYLTWLYAIWTVGCCAVPINRRLHPVELGWIVEHCQARLCIGDDDLLASSEGRLAGRILNADDVDMRVALDGRWEPPADVPASDPAWLFYTSGSTGRPKGAMLSHRNLLAMATSAVVDFGPLTSSSRSLAVAPLSHGAGLLALSFTLVGAAHVLPASHGFDAAEFLDLVSAHPGSVAFLVPTMVRRIVDTAAGGHPVTHENLSTIIYGGAPMMAADVRRALQCFGPRLAQLYAQGESPMTVSALAKELHEAGSNALLRSAGFARTGIRITVRRADGSACDPGEIGEVTVSGETVMLGYWRDPDATRATIRDGWLWTGDLGRMDDGGLLTLTGRSKEMIISGGSNVYPREVEEVLAGHPLVREVAVVGHDDPEWGEAVVAYVELADPHPGAETLLRQSCAERLARYKIPKRFIFRPLPRNAAGKIDKLVLARTPELPIPVDAS